MLPLVKMFLESSDRWEQRDAAFALLALHLNQQELQLAAAAVIAHNPGLLSGQTTQHTSNSSTNGAVSCTSNPSSSRQVSHLSGMSTSHEQGICSGSGVERSSNMDARYKTVLQQQGSAKLDRQLLARYRWCSQQYLDGKVIRNHSHMYLEPYTVAYSGGCCQDHRLPCVLHCYSSMQIALACVCSDVIRVSRRGVHWRH